MVRAESLPQRGCRSGYMEHRPRNEGRQRGLGPLRAAVTSATTATAASRDWGSGTAPDVHRRVDGCGTSCETDRWVIQHRDGSGDPVDRNGVLIRHRAEHDRGNGALAHDPHPAIKRDIGPEIGNGLARPPTRDSEGEDSELVVPARRHADEEPRLRHRPAGGIEVARKPSPDRFAGGVFGGDIKRPSLPMHRQRHGGPGRQPRPSRARTAAQRRPRRGPAPSPSMSSRCAAATKVCATRSSDGAVGSLG